MPTSTRNHRKTKRDDVGIVPYENKHDEHNVKQHNRTVPLCF